MKMTRLLQALCVLLCLLTLFSACSAPATAPASVKQSDERALSDVRMQYRDASLVVSGICEGVHSDSAGNACYDITVAEVFAGSANAGDKMHCAGQTMQQGEEYVLFFKEGEDVYYAEDTLGFELLAGKAIDGVQSEEILWDSKYLAMDDFREEMRRLQNSIKTPTPVYYYSTLKGLVAVAEDVFIGRVTALPPMQSYDFSIRSRGNLENAQYDAAIVTIEAYGTIKGALSYGQQIEIVYCPMRASGMLDAETLQPRQYTAQDVLQLEAGGVYMFFLIAGPDGKQEYYFPVNPVQGFMKIVGEDVRETGDDGLLSNYQALTPLVLDLQQAIYEARLEERQQNPPLIIEE